MAAEVHFRFEPAGERERIVVPAFAVGEDREGRYVYVVEEVGDGVGRAVRREVTVGGLTADGGLEILRRTGRRRARDHRRRKPHPGRAARSGWTRSGSEPMTRWAIEKDRITYAALLLVAVGGLFAFFNLPQAEDPGFIIRVAMVATYLPGASPERVENLVTDKIEEVVQEIPELDFVSSQSRTGRLAGLRQHQGKLQGDASDLGQPAAQGRPHPRRACRRTRSDRSSTTSSATCSASCWR